VIVTRRRRKPFPWKRLILPVIAIGLVIFAVTWGPSRSVITAGPLAPFMRSTSSAFTTVAAPFHFAAQNELITDRNREIAQLQAQVTSLQAQSAAKDKQINSLNAQVAQAQSSSAGAPVSATQPSAPATASQSNPSAGLNAVPAAGGAAGGDLASGASADMRRTAADWANMQPENAAKVVQKLPVTYVARVLALMSPDDVGSILDALPANYAAALTQENPELSR
jgi:Tfp pilus assembly protein FimV